MRWKRAIFLVVLILLIVGGLFWRFGVPESGRELLSRLGIPGFAAKATINDKGPPPVPVTAGTAENRNMPVYVEGLGTVQAFNTVAVKSRVDGQITKVFFREGQEVKTGDSLFQIDPRPFQNAVQQAEATKEKDAAQLQSAQLDLERAAKLLTPGFQTRQGYDQQKATVGQLQASIKADQAQIDTAKLNLEYSLVKSPIDGRTGQRLVDIGNLVQAAQSANLVTITQLRPIFVSFTVPAERLGDIRKSESQQHTKLKVIAYAMDDKTRIAEGELTLVDNQVDQATGTIHLKAQFANADEPLWPGQFVNARIVLSTRENAVTVPQVAVMEGPNGAYVYVIGNDDTVKRRPVVVAANQEDLAVIGQGLQPGERIVVEGQYRLTDGAKVRLGAPGQTAPQAQAQLGGQAAQ
ncbi:MAG TPA: efflux RND transporter periplasmic adaptor subunit [Xanthobacteraceae bacterium]|nr:efflux RND transporter periplasmic adaptor subunit [Xanthobacteraceae bacterium]